MANLTTTLDAVIITARMTAIEGQSVWRMPLPATPSLLDIVTQGYALICYDGSRAPRSAKCVGCYKQTSHAWRIHPIGFTVAACTGDCAADKIERLWAEATETGAIHIRVHGDEARSMAGLDAA